MFWVWHRAIEELIEYVRIYCAGIMNVEHLVLKTKERCYEHDDIKRAR